MELEMLEPTLVSDDEGFDYAQLTSDDEEFDYAQLTSDDEEFDYAHPMSGYDGCDCECQDPDKLSKQIRWQLWGKIPQLVDHMDSCCSWLEELLYKSVGDPQWEWVFSRSLQDPSHPRCGVFKRLVDNNQTAALLDLLPAGPVKDSVTKLLLFASVKFGLGDLTLHLLQGDSVSDSDVMDAIKFAVQLMDKTVFLRLVTDCPLTSRVFKQQFAEQTWDVSKFGVEEGGELDWIYDALIEGGHKDLALYVAVEAIPQYGTYLIVDFCLDAAWNEKYTLRKLYQRNEKTKYCELLKELCGSDDSKTPVLRTMFRKAVEKAVDYDHFNIFVKLCSEGHRQCFHKNSLSMKDLAKEDMHFSYSAALKKERSQFAYKLLKEMSGNEREDVQDERNILFEAVVDSKRWDLLPVLLSSLKHTGLFNLLEMLSCKMLQDKSCWEHMAPILDKVVKEQAVTFQKEEVNAAMIVLEETSWPFSVPSLERWCVHSGHAYLALFLDLVTLNWERVKTVLSALPSLDLHPTTLKAAVQLSMTVDLVKSQLNIQPFLELLAEGLFFANVHTQPWFVFSTDAAVHLLRKYHITAEVLDLFTGVFDWHLLAHCCFKHGLIEWYIVLWLCNSGDWYFLRNDMSMLKECQNSVIVNFIMSKAFLERVDLRLDVAKQLLNRCTDPEVWKLVLIGAVNAGEFDMAKRLIGRVDPTTCAEGNKSLLFLAVSADCSVETKMKMVRLCLSAGLSPFHRELSVDEDTCPLLHALKSGDDDIVSLLVSSGAYSHRSLKTVMQRRVASSGQDATVSTGFRAVREAADTPFRLDHMARMTVSRLIGCQPGRSDRIGQLDITEPQTDMVNFWDVVAIETKE